MGNIVFSFGAGLNDTVFGKVQAPVRAMIEQRAEAFQQTSMLKNIYNFGTSKHFAETIASMTGMEGFQPVGEGAAYPMDGMQEGFSKVISHVEWKNAFAITQAAIEDAKIIDLRKKPEAFVTSYYRTREKFGADMLAGGLGSSITFGGMKFDTTAADGKPLFATDHPSALTAKGVKKVAAQSNRFAGALDNKVLGRVATRMQNYADDRGEVMAVAPDTIIIPNDEELKYKVFEAIGADKDPETSNNGFNYHYGMWNVIVWPYLNALLDVAAGDKPFILLDSAYNKLYDGADWLERVKLTVKSKVDDNDNNVWKGRARFGVGFNDWRAFAIGGITGGTAL